MREREVYLISRNMLKIPPRKMVPVHWLYRRHVRNIGQRGALREHLEVSHYMPVATGSKTWRRKHT